MQQQPPPPLPDQAKETTIFSLTNDYFKSLLYYELDTTCNDLTLNEINLKQIINSNDDIVSKIQSIYLLYGNRRLLIVTKPDTNDLSELNHLLLNLFDSNKQENLHLLKMKNIPCCSSTPNNEQPLLLVAELTDYHLKQINQDKNIALKAIESKTGLKLKKVKKTFYFSGLLFQFVILNEILNEETKKKTSNSLSTSSEESIKLETSSSPLPTEMNSIKSDLPSWLDMYNESSVKGQFMLKPKDETLVSSDFYYNVYIFEADLTDLTTDAIVNAANPNLHPGYDGIARRLREKAGKQMQDACKRIIKQDRNNVFLKESECVFTKTYGKLKSKYVIHSVSPTWTNYVSSLNNSLLTMSTISNESSPSVSLSSPSSSSSSSSSYKNSIDSSSEKFEYLLDQTFTNIFKLAHDTSKLQINSIGIPVMSTTQGGAFDLPLDLCAHTIYTQLIDFKPSSSNEFNKNLNTICITSLETNTVKMLCDIFKNYTDCYSESSWAIPTSPLSKLTSTVIEEKQLQLVKTNPKESTLHHSITVEETKQEEPILPSHLVLNHNESKLEVAPTYKSISQNENNNTRSISVTIQQSDHTLNNNSNSRIVTLNEDTTRTNNFSSSLVTIKQSDQNNFHHAQQQQQHYSTQRHPRTLSNSSSNSHENTYFKQLDTAKSNNRYINNSANLNDLAECFLCQKEMKYSNKLLTCGSQNCSSVFCYHCLNNFWINTKTQKCPSCRNNFDKSSLTNLKEKHHSSSSSSPSHVQPVYENNHNAIKEAKIFVKLLDEPCEGYEKFRTLLVTFEIEDGIQNDNHPKPGQPYKGTYKRAYLPEIKEHREILSFYEKALKTGRLFRISFSKQHGDFRALLNQDVLLKTSPNGGGRFGYPDSSYIKDLLQMARSLK